MKKIIIDCNVIVAAAFGSKTCIAAIVESIENNQIYLSSDIKGEYLSMLERPKFSNIKNRLDKIISLVIDEALIVSNISLHPEREKISDIKDRIYLDLGHCIGDCLLITGNHRDFIKNNYGNVRIIKPNNII